MGWTRRRTRVRGPFSQVATRLRGQMASSGGELLQQGTRRPHRFFAEILSRGRRGSRHQQSRGERFNPPPDSRAALQATGRERSAGLRQGGGGPGRGNPKQARPKTPGPAGGLFLNPRIRFPVQKKTGFREYFRPPPPGNRSTGLG